VLLVLSSAPPATQTPLVSPHSDAAGFQLRKNLDGHYEHVKATVRSTWPFLDDDLEDGDRIDPDA
jgi:hypothetical protein